jgi:hypothetical protein
MGLIVAEGLQASDALFECYTGNLVAVVQKAVLKGRGFGSRVHGCELLVVEVAVAHVRRVRMTPTGVHGLPYQDIATWKELAQEAGIKPQ